MWIYRVGRESGLGEGGGLRNRVGHCLGKKDGRRRRRREGIYPAAKGKCVEAYRSTTYPHQKEEKKTKEGEARRQVSGMRRIYLPWAFMLFLLTVIYFSNFLLFLL